MTQDFESKKPFSTVKKQTMQTIKLTYIKSSNSKKIKKSWKTQTPTETASLFQERQTNRQAKDQ